MNFGGTVVGWGYVYIRWGAAEFLALLAGADSQSVASSSRLVRARDAESFSVLGRRYE